MTTLILVPLVPQQLDATVPGGGEDVATDTLWTQKGDLAVATGPAAASALNVGTDAQALVADSAQPTGLKWAAPTAAAHAASHKHGGSDPVSTATPTANAIPKAGSGGTLARGWIPAIVATDPIFDAKGDLAVGAASDMSAKVSVGSDGQTLVADSTQTAGVRWATPVATGGQVLVTGLDPTGVTNATTLIQAAHDANPGAQLALDGSGTPTYKVTTPFFVDETGADALNRGVVIDGNGAILKMDTTLPGITTFTPDVNNVKGWAFANTKRTAYDAGANTVAATVGNQALSSGANQKPKLILRNFTIDCSALSPAHGGIPLYGNGPGGGTGMEFCRLIAQRAGISWNDYTDKSFMRDCSATGALTIGSYGIYQINNGDNVQWVGNHGRACAYKGLHCHGLTLIGGVACEHVLDQCSFHCLDLHSEDDQAGSKNPGVTIKNSWGVIEGGQMNPPHVGNSSGVPASIYIDDSTNLSYGGASVVEVHHVTFKHNYRGETDPAFRPDILVHSFNPDSCLKVRDCYCFFDVSGGSQTGLIAASDDVNITAALNGAYGLLGGSWELWQRRGVWTVTPIGRGPRFVRTKPQPTGVAVANDSNVTGAILTTREYCAAALDESGGYGLVSAAANVTTPASGTNRIHLSCQDTCQLVVWYSESAGTVTTAPVGYAILNWPGASLGELWDAGTSISGIPWVLSAVPVPNTVAAVDHTASALVLDVGNLTRQTQTLIDLATVTPDPGFAGGILTTLSQATTIANPGTGSLGLNAPINGQNYLLRIKSSSSRNLTWGAQYRAGTTVSLPAATTGSSKTDYLLFVFNATDTKWDVFVVDAGF